MSIASASLRNTPPLENGDHLTAEEFHRRYEAMAEKVKAELIDGIVYMAADVPTRSLTSGTRSNIPPLENGDQLSVEEFERRYRAMPGVKAELIQGVVYVASPVRTDVHAEPHGALVGWLAIYASSHARVQMGDNGTIELPFGERPQPDAFLRYMEGASRMTAEGYIQGAPELVVEVSASTASVDLFAKKEGYRAAGVQEYIVWRVLDDDLDWFVLRDKTYERMAADEGGILRSEAFPGLRLNVPALLARDYATVLREQFDAKT